MTGVLITNPVSKHQGTIIKEVEVVIIIIIGIPGMAIEIIEAEVDSPAIEVEDLEDVSIEVDTGNIEGKKKTFGVF